MKKRKKNEEKKIKREEIIKKKWKLGKKKKEKKEKRKITRSELPGSGVLSSLEEFSGFFFLLVEEGGLVDAEVAGLLDLLSFCGINGGGS